MNVQRDLQAGEPPTNQQTSTSFSATTVQIDTAACAYDKKQLEQNGEVRISPVGTMHLVLAVTLDGLSLVQENISAWCAYTGQTRAAAQGWGWLDAVHPDDRERVARAWAQAIATKHPYETEYRLRRADGLYRSFLVHAMPVHDPDGHLRAWIATCIDITEHKQLEGELRASEERFRATFEQAAVGLAHMGLDWRWLLVNQRFCDIVGYTREELLAQTFQDITHPDDLQANLECLCRLLTGELQTCTTEKRYIRKDGSLVWAHLTLSLVRDASGLPQYFISVIEDISGRKRIIEEERTQPLASDQTAPAEAMARAHQLEAIFEAMADGVFVYDQNGYILQANTAGRDLLALTNRSDYLRLPPAARGALLAMRDEHGHPLAEEHWPQNRALRGEVFKGPTAMDLIVRALDGHDILLNSSGAPVRDATGHLIGGVTVFRDVTARRQLEQRTHDALQALLAMAEALVPTPDIARAAVEQTAAGRVEQRLAALTRSILGCQRTGIVTLEPETLVFCTLATSGVLREREQHLWPVLQGSQLGDHVDHALVRRLQAGEVLRINLRQPPFNDLPSSENEVLAAPMLLGNHLIGILGLQYENIDAACTPETLALARAVARLAALIIERDRLLRERATAQANELALREANRRMDEFLSIVIHELRTPLTAAKGNIQLLKRRVGNWIDAEPGHANDRSQIINVAQEPLERIERQVDRLSRLVNDLLDASRIKAGHLKLHPALCDLVEIVREAVEEQRLVYPMRTITFTADSERTVPVLADANRIGQVVTNYLTNALAYSGDDRPVIASVQVADQMARVSVHDEGPGLSPAEQAYIWERFYRLGKPTTFGAGLGLGLYISQIIVEQHQGQIGVESSVGAGSTFWFTLPLARAQ
jgi:PAS domain S-box-containing protein